MLGSVRGLMRLVVACIIVAAHAHALWAADVGCQGTQHRFCSKTFQAVMRCDDKTGLAGIAGNHCPAGKACAYCPTGRDCPLIEPWEPVPIHIKGIEIAVTGGAISWAFAGNNHVPDVMADMGAGQTHRQQWFPDGLAFSMPAAGTPGEHHIDLHVVCPPAKSRRLPWLFARAPEPAWVHLRYTIYYIVAPPADVSAVAETK